MAVYGIDLGTTYSCIAGTDENGRAVVYNEPITGLPTMPSAVFFETPGNVVVGEAAKGEAIVSPERVVQSIKREIGKADALVRQFHGQSYSPAHISSIILRRLGEYVTEQTGEAVRDVVITCPAYFGLQERAETRKAGEMAGLNVLSIINEPTAAAIDYCAREFQEERTVLIFDLGGGTFDVTILRMQEVYDAAGVATQVVRVLKTGGNDRLGGVDWDNRLMSELCRRYCEENGLEVGEALAAPELRQQLRARAEELKRKLTNVETSRITVHYEGIPTKMSFTRADFEALTADLVQQTVTYVEQALARASMTPEQIDTVLLVGGSTRMPMILQSVNGLFPGRVRFNDPDLSVARGAALYASLIVEELGEAQRDDAQAPVARDTEPEAPGVPPAPRLRVQDIVPRSFGPAVLDKDRILRINNIILLDSDLPAVAEKIYYTPVCDMERIVLPVYETTSQDEWAALPGEDAEPESEVLNEFNVRMLGSVEMTLPEGTAENAPVKVRFSMDMGGTLTVLAEFLNTGKAVEAVIETVSVTTPEQDQAFVEHIRQMGIVGE